MWPGDMDALSHASPFPVTVVVGMDPDPAYVQPMFVVKSRARITRSFWSASKRVDCCVAVVLQRALGTLEFHAMPVTAEDKQSAARGVGAPLFQSFTHTVPFPATVLITPLPIST